MPQTVAPDTDDAADTNLETEPSEEPASADEDVEASETEEETAFYIPTPGGLRGL